MKELQVLWWPPPRRWIHLRFHPVHGANVNVNCTGHARCVLVYSCGKCHAIRMQSGVCFASPGSQTSPTLMSSIAGAIHACQRLARTQGTGMCPQLLDLCSELTNCFTQWKYFPNQEDVWNVCLRAFNNTFLVPFLARIYAEDISQFYVLFYAFLLNTQVKRGNWKPS